MHGHGPFVVFHRQPTRRQLIGARIGICIYLAFFCAIPVELAFLLSREALPVWHWTITFSVVAVVACYIVYAAKGGLECHDYEQQEAA